MISTVGAWAASSSRPDAYRLHFGTLVPAGALYAALTVTQFVRAKTSNTDVQEAWPSLTPGGQDLSIVQAKARTILIVGGVLGAVTTVLVVAAIVASRATRSALLRIEGDGGGYSTVDGRRRRRRRFKTSLSRGEKMVAAWALALAATSTFLDGSFAVFSAWLARDRKQSVWLVAFWQAMGRGDRRYGDCGFDKYFSRGGVNLRERCLLSKLVWCFGRFQAGRTTAGGLFYVFRSGVFSQATRDERCSPIIEEAPTKH